MRWWHRCWRCSGEGFVRVTTDRIVPRDEETPHQTALRLLEGGRWYHVARETCPRCEGTGKR